jgi:hypothetical protein|tara:strand:- start:688 stop:858 length:171 start_codon:yes stop_codon:yes gene_type:complete
MCHVSSSSQFDEQEGAADELRAANGQLAQVNRSKKQKNDEERMSCARPMVSSRRLN